MEAHQFDACEPGPVATGGGAVFSLVPLWEL